MKHAFYLNKSNIHLSIKGFHQTRIQSPIAHMLIEFSKIGEKERTWIASWVLKWGNMISSIIGAKQSYALQWGLMSINHQTNTPFKLILKMMSRMLDPPPRSKLLLHELILWIPLFGIMKFVHACWKTMKIPKKMHAIKKFGNKSLLETRIFIT